MGLEQIYQEWLSSLDLDKSRVIRFPSLIFLCGGPISKNGENFKSCRDIFYRYIKESKYSFRENVVLVEEVFRYFIHSEYKDLICFEKDLAELSVLTVIFSESPGSIAELGAFTVLEKVGKKLLVVMHQDDADKESFIWRGPALYLKELARKAGRADPVAIYNWRKKDTDADILKKVDFSDTEDLAEAIQAVLSKFPKTEIFDKNQPGHVMLLMLDLLNIVRLATEDEIDNFLSSLHIAHERQTLEQYLSLLFSLNLAVKKPYRNNVYYVSLAKRPWLSLSFKESAKIRDFNRWEAKFIEFYSREQNQKLRALKSYMKSSGLIGD